jgi:hypothetical protein
MKGAFKSTILALTVVNLLSFFLLLAIANAQTQRHWKFREEIPFFHIQVTGEFFYDPLWIPSQFEYDIPGSTNNKDFDVIAEDGKLSGRKEVFCQYTGQSSYWDIQGTYSGDQYEFTIVDDCSGCDPAPCEHRQPWTIHATGQLKGSKIEGITEGSYTVFWPYKSTDSRNQTQVWTWSGTFTSEVTKGGGSIDSHDLAILSVKPPKKIKLTESKPTQTKATWVQIINRGTNTESIADLAVLGQLINLGVESLGACPAPIPQLLPPKQSFPLVIRPKKKLGVVYNVTYDCANDGLQATNDGAHADFRYTAQVHHSALEGYDDEVPTNDTCPRNPSTGDDGCGSKKPDGTLGGDVLTDVIIKVK